MSDTHRHNALLLAAQLDSRILDELLRPGDAADERTRLPTVALRGTAGHTDDWSAQLLDLLAAANRATPNATDSATGPMAAAPRAARALPLPS